jgi:hypothetical protein
MFHKQKKKGERTINRTNIVYIIKEKEDKGLMKKPNEKEINSMYFLAQII